MSAPTTLPSLWEGRNPPKGDYGEGSNSCWRDDLNLSHAAYQIRIANQDVWRFRERPFRHRLQRPRR